MGTLMVGVVLALMLVGPVRASAAEGQMTWALHFSLAPTLFEPAETPGLFQEQAGERDLKKREAILHRVQQLMHEKVIYLPVWQLATLTGYGPRVAEPGLGLITEYPWSVPYEDVKLKAK